jgi:hypothetical protein
MSRLRVIIGGTALALLAAAVPIAVMAYATWDRAVSVEQQRLRDIADRTLRRSDLSYQEALAREIGRGRCLRPCSPTTSGACRRW